MNSKRTQLAFIGGNGDLFYSKMTKRRAYTRTYKISAYRADGRIQFSWGKYIGW
jgi:hypothetical protein